MRIYDALDVARHIIIRSNSTGLGISNLKLQKILYFVQSYFLIRENHVCFRDRIEAWNFGPVVPSVYREYKQFCGTWIPFAGGPEPIADDRAKALIDEVVDRFADRSSTQLVEITLKQKPWRDAYSHYMVNEIIPEALRNYFCA